MFTVVKIRDDLAAGDYRDPGWYKHPPGTVAWQLSDEEQKKLLG
jgi:manganese oxidase